MHTQHTQLLLQLHKTPNLPDIQVFFFAMCGPDIQQKDRCCKVLTSAVCQLLLFTDADCLWKAVLCGS